ncbi:MAG: S1 family peptidase [Gemmatimonadetes bacterium]|nr:S1 family peptidase [Gemmatimonadota bacterium]
MKSMALSVRLLTAATVLVLAACQDAPQPLAPEVSAASVGADRASDALREVMALDRTVFGGQDAAGQLVIGVENAGVASGVRNVMERFGIAPSGYRIEITEPIHFATETLRTVHRPTRGGIQIHFSNYLCTLGFNVDHAGGRSFITNSHCTAQQGSIDGVAYYQPTSSTDPNPIAHEADDPAYFKGGECSRGKVCRYSDAARALYQTGIDSNAEIAKTTKGVNSGDLAVNGAFEVTSQDNSSTTFSGTVNKVGRTTGWTAGNVTDSCVTVNVSGSNIQLLCQTLVENASTQIVGSGDSGSPVFTTDGTNANLIGILWGGNSSGTLFVFSPFKAIQDELGTLNALTDGTGTGGSDGGGDGGGDCTPRGNSGNCH